MLLNSNQRFESELIVVDGTPEIHEVDVPSLLSDLPEEQFLVFSPTGLGKLGVDSQRYEQRSIADNIPHSIVPSVLEGITIPETCEEIMAFGAGRAVDMAKYLGQMNARPVNVVPSILSTNAFGTPFGCYEAAPDDHTKTTVKTGYAAKILVDFAYLEAQGSSSLYGLADALSITTALHDWDLAATQDPSVVDQEVYDIAKAIEDSSFAGIQAGRLNIRNVFNLIVNSAYITGLHGSGRPESGSEHIFSKVIELKALHEGDIIMHGQSVSLGILLMSILQGNSKTAEAFEVIRNLRFLDNFEADQDDLKTKVSEVLTRLEPHPVRYSVVDAQIDNLRDPEFSSDLAAQAINELFAPKD